MNLNRFFPRPQGTWKSPEVNVVDLQMFTKHLINTYLICLASFFFFFFCFSAHLNKAHHRTFRTYNFHFLQFISTKIYNTINWGTAYPTVWKLIINRRRNSVQGAMTSSRKFWRWQVSLAVTTYITDFLYIKYIQI